MSLDTNVSGAQSEGFESETEHGGRHPVYKEIRQFTVNGTVSPLPSSSHRSMYVFSENS